MVQEARFARNNDTAQPRVDLCALHSASHHKEDEGKGGLMGARFRGLAGAPVWQVVTSTTIEGLKRGVKRRLY